MARKDEAESVGGIRATVFLVLAMVSGAVGVYVLFTGIEYYKAQISEARRPEETVVAIRAAKELYPGAVIQESDIVGVEIAKKYVPEEALTTPEAIVHRTPRERILANEFILPGRLADADAGVGLNALIPVGWRALSVNLSEGAALSGHLTPGNRVDVLVTVEEEDSRLSRTTTMVQNVPVLAVNQTLITVEVKQVAEVGKPKKTIKKLKPSVTLAVTPEQAERITYSERKGEITLTLRNDDDLEMRDEHSMQDRESLLGLEEELEAPIPIVRRKARVEKEEPTLDMISGTKKRSLRSDGSRVP